MIKVRKNAQRKFELGTTFIEKDGPYELIQIDEVWTWVIAPVYDLTLRKFTPDEMVIWEIHNA